MYKLRFAPSPTGKLHIGNIRVLLFNHVFRLSQPNTQLYLRIDDTDKLRNNKLYEDDAFDTFKMLNISFDKIFRQSNRFEIYKQKAEELLANGSAFLDNGAIIFNTELFKSQIKNLQYSDIVYGDIKVALDNIENFVLLRKDKTPTFILASTIDDIEMGITHVIRGNDHISNVLKGLLIHKGLGIPNKILYAHLPLIHSDDNLKISKRNESVINIEYFIKEGFVKEGIVNYLFKLGWGYQNYEYFTLQEISNVFKLSQIKKSSSRFDIDKMKAINAYHLRKMSKPIIVERIKEFCHINEINTTQTYNDCLLRIVEVFLHRVYTIKEIVESSMFIMLFKNHIQAFIHKYEFNEYKDNLKQLLLMLENNSFDKCDNTLHSFVREILTGCKNGIDTYTIINLIGKDKVHVELSSLNKIH